MFEVAHVFLTHSLGHSREAGRYGAQALPMARGVVLVKGAKSRFFSWLWGGPCQMRKFEMSTLFGPVLATPLILQCAHVVFCV